MIPGATPDGRGKAPPSPEHERHAALLDATVAAMSEAILVVDVTGRVRFANPAAVRDVGYDPVGTGPAEGAARFVLARLDGTPVPIEENPAARACGGVSVAGERLQVVDAAGRRFVVAASAAPLRIGGELDGAVLVWHDVTDEERLRERAERHAAELDAVFVALPFPIVVYDGEGRIIRMNEAAQALFRYDAVQLALPYEERLMASPFRRPDGSPPSPSELPVPRALGGERVQEELVRYEAPGAPRRWFAASAAPIRKADGTIVGAVASLSEVTRLQELREGVEDLSRAVSHDLRTPLSTVLIQSQSLARMPGVGEEVVRRAGAIGTSARRMAAMIRDLAELTRLEAGRLELELQVLELPAFVAELSGRLAGTLDLGRVRFLIPAGLPALRADPDRLERILVNLLTNALKYSPEDRPVTLTAAPADGGVAIAVRDEGPGIPVDEQPRLFERFWRSRRTAGREGLGLGLHIARQLVLAHGGRIEVDTAEDRGTVFRVTLPAAR